ncbi:MAG: peroxiredoxin [Sphingopyxis sp.]|nr:peroxiredoxin [Sphingopyxis sp.]
MNRLDASASIPKPGYGTPAPWFKAPIFGGNPQFTFHTVAGRVIILFFMRSATDPSAQAALATLMKAADRFDDARGCFFGISCDPDDAAAGRLDGNNRGIRFLLDADRSISKPFGAAREASSDHESYILILDRQLRVAGQFSPSRATEALALFDRLLGEIAADEWAPVLLVPRIIEPALCERLVGLYDAGGSIDSGFMREIDGKTVSVIDHGYKRRSDLTIRDETLCRSLSARVNCRLRPAVNRAFSFDASRMERYIVACYDATTGGHFRPHRDNTTKGTAHRRFAVTINLNDDFDGGELRFPEFGRRTYRAPVGGAIVFGCGLLHEATPVTRGRRYAFLPFLYDDAAAAERAANNVYLGEGVQPYRYG